jgi:hypothetical protein
VFLDAGDVPGHNKGFKMTKKQVVEFENKMSVAFPAVGVKKK